MTTKSLSVLFLALCLINILETKNIFENINLNEQTISEKKCSSHLPQPKFCCNNASADPFIITNLAENLKTLMRQDNVIPLDTVVTKIDELFGMPQEAFDAAQKEYNSTDEILNALDDLIIQNSQHKSVHHDLIIKNSIIVQTFNIKKTRIAGIALYKNGNMTTNEVIYRNSTPRFADANFIVAAYLPQSLLKQIEDTLEDPVVAITIFLEKKLFVEEIKNNDKEMKERREKNVKEEEINVGREEETNVRRGKEANAGRMGDDEDIFGNKREEKVAKVGEEGMGVKEKRRLRKGGKDEIKIIGKIEGAGKTILGRKEVEEKGSKAGAKVGIGVEEEEIRFKKRGQTPEDDKTNIIETNAKISGQKEGKAFGVLIPGFKNKFNAPIRLIYKRSKEESHSMQCAYWFYGFEKKGRWQNEKASSLCGDVEICEYFHVTHFGMLISKSTNDMRTHRDALDVITLVGSVLSLFGISGIFLTALLFKEWRKNKGNFILMNYSATTLLEIVFLYYSGFIKENYACDDVWCFWSGIFLHYVVLAQFFWVLVISYLQYKRYVQIVGAPLTRIVLKSCLIGWCGPLFVVIPLGVYSRCSYVQNNANLCYPSGLSLYLGVIFPILLIVFVNLVVFVLILASIFYPKKERVVNNLNILKARLVVLLFFQLGISWIFGFLGNAHIAFTYFFCLTVTNQGWVVFLIFIVFNEINRNLYVKYFGGGKRDCNAFPSLKCDLFKKRRKYLVTQFTTSSNSI